MTESRPKRLWTALEWLQEYDGNYDEAIAAADWHRVDCLDKDDLEGAEMYNAIVIRLTTKKTVMEEGVDGL